MNIKYKSHTIFIKHQEWFSRPPTEDTFELPVGAIILYSYLGIQDGEEGLKITYAVPVKTSEETLKAPDAL